MAAIQHIISYKSYMHCKVFLNILDTTDFINFMAKKKVDKLEKKAKKSSETIAFRYNISPRGTRF